MEKELRQVISAIENGKKIQDNRGIVYTQEFGASFINKLKNIVNQQSYICPKTNQNCDDEMCDSASNCNISSEIKENKDGVDKHPRRNDRKVIRRKQRKS